jgi:hypothetical protein
MITTYQRYCFSVDMGKGIFNTKAKPYHTLPMNWTKNLISNTSQGRIYEFFKVGFYHWVWFSKGEGGGPPLFLFSKGRSLLKCAISTLFSQNGSDPLDPPMSQYYNVYISQILYNQLVDSQKMIKTHIELFSLSKLRFCCLSTQPKFASFEFNFISVIHHSL